MTSAKDWTILGVLVGLAAIFITYLHTSGAQQQTTDINPADLALATPASTAAGATASTPASVSPQTQSVASQASQSGQSRMNKWRGHASRLWQTVTTPPSSTTGGCGGCGGCGKQQAQIPVNATGNTSSANTGCGRQRVYNPAPITSTDINNLQTGTVPAKWAPRPIGVPVRQMVTVPQFTRAHYEQGSVTLGDYPNLSATIA